MTKDGVIKVRSYARLPEEQRWDIDLMNQTCGVPWEPIPGHGMREIMSQVYIPVPKDLSDVPDPVPRENPKRRMYMSQKDIQAWVAYHRMPRV